MSFAGKVWRWWTQSRRSCRTGWLTCTSGSRRQVDCEGPASCCPPASRGGPSMNIPIYQQALGSDYGRLQPELQEYFALVPGSGQYGVGEGTFDVVGCRQDWLRPLLQLAGSEEAFFPEYGENVPFRIENHAHQDPFGRSSLTARREIRFPDRTRIFQDTTSVTGAAGAPRLVDYVGRYRRMVTDLNLSVTAEGRLRGVSEASRLFLGPL